MSIALALLAAASAAPVSGDIDKDGAPDRAYVREANGGHELVIERGSGAAVTVQAIPDLANFFLSRIAPGTYRTACAKGAGPSGAPCDEPVIDVEGDAVQFGTLEASQAALIWDRGEFRVVWLSD